ncbi:hypothetical protein EBU99_13470 [bacterium]|nr:hypothetical protein [bacterium]
MIARNLMFKEREGEILRVREEDIQTRLTVNLWGNSIHHENSLLGEMSYFLARQTRSFPFYDIRAQELSYLQQKTASGVGIRGQAKPLL